MRELGMNEGTLGSWVNQYRKDHADEVSPLTVSERARLPAAERELREVRMENGFLKKAAAYFARDPRQSISLSSSTRVEMTTTTRSTRIR